MVLYKDYFNHGSVHKLMLLIGEMTVGPMVLADKDNTVCLHIVIKNVNKDYLTCTNRILQLQDF